MLDGLNLFFYRLGLMEVMGCLVGLDVAAGTFRGSCCAMGGGRHAAEWILDHMDKVGGICWVFLKYFVGRGVANQSWSESGLTACAPPLDDRRTEPPGVIGKEYVEGAACLCMDSGGCGSN